MNERQLQLSIVLITRDEGERLGATLDSVTAGFAGGVTTEIIVGDTGSIDGTVAVARDHGARVIEIPFEGFGRTKQRVVDEAAGEWILALDADEILDERLREAIGGVVTGLHANDGWYLQRRAWFLGTRIHHGGWGRDRVLRLFRNGSGRYDDALVHEKITVDGDTGTLPGVLEHHTDPTLSGYLRKIDRYSHLAAQKIARDPAKNTGAWAGLVHGTARLWRQLVFRGGWRDGLPGVILAVSSAYSSFLRYTRAELIRRGRDDAEA